MEDLLILLLQGLGQLLFEICAYFPWDLVSYALPDEKFDESKSQGCTTFVAIPGSIAMGALAGWASLYFFPDVLVKWGWLRVALLFISPIISGLMAMEMARWRQERDARIIPSFHFWISLCFSVGLVWVRFALAHRPA
jgi:hypothetical protein